MYKESLRIAMVDPSVMQEKMREFDEKVHLLIEWNCF